MNSLAKQTLRYKNLILSHKDVSWEITEQQEGEFMDYIQEAINFVSTEELDRDFVVTIASFLSGKVLKNMDPNEDIESDLWMVYNDLKG